MIRSQWNAPGIGPTASCDATDNWKVREDCFCDEFAAGRSVFICGKDRERDHSIASDEAQSSMLVPFMMDGEYAGAVGFDSIRTERRFDPAVVSALEIAAGVVGAALQRERLLETMRREREEAAEQRVAQLARANAALRQNLERLSTQPAQFFDLLMLDATRHAGAASGSAIILAYDSDRWIAGSHVSNDRIEPAPFASSLPAADTPLMKQLTTLTGPLHVETRGNFMLAEWPEFHDYHLREGHESLYFLPLFFGDRNLGFVVLGFRQHEPVSLELAELLVAFGQQVTLALGMKRLMVTAKQGAVLAERNRIGREIHDGVAQAFTGILLQLGAVEETCEGSPVAKVLGRVRDIAKEGLVEARRAVFALRPEEQRVGGLELALRQLAERSTVAGRVASVFNCNGEGGGTRPATRARARAAAHRAGSGDQRCTTWPAPQRRDSPRLSRQRDRAQHPRRWARHDGSARALRAAGLRPCEHA